MKNLIYSVSVFLIGISTTACHKEKLLVIGSGSQTTEVRNVTDFSGIELKMSATVEYVQDSIYKVEVTAQSNLLSVIETAVYGTVLRIDNKAWISSRSKSVKIVVHSPDMNKLRVSGSGNIYPKTGITTNSMEISISGSGNIEVPAVMAQNLTCRISGSGDIKIYGGTVATQKLSISGSGDIETQELVSGDCSVDISGSGDADLYAAKTLDVTISGSGDVQYSGTPVINSKISGSGNLTHL